MNMLYFISGLVLMIASTKAADTYTFKTYQSDALYLVGNRDQTIRCSKSGDRLTFNTLTGLTGEPGHVSLKSANYARYYAASNSQNQLISMEQFVDNYLFKLYGSFVERKNHFYTGTVSYESLLYPGRFLMCQGGKLQIMEAQNVNKAMRASFVLEVAQSTDDLWGPCSRSCGGGTQKAKPKVCLFFWLCESERTRSCNLHDCAGPCNPNPCYNGGACSIRFNNKYKCDCPPTHKGNRCQTEIHPCDQNPCQNGGTCRRTGSSYRCDCRSGYTGIHCQNERHPCEGKPCLNGGTCVRFPKDYVCNCGHRFTGKNCGTLIRETCTPSYCQNGGTCIERQSGLHCICPSRYTGDRCQTEIRERCTHSYCQNGGTCVERHSGLHCNCPSRYTGNRCQTEIRERCTRSYCQNGGTCVERQSGLRCNCPPGYTGDRCQTDVDPCSFKPCLNGGTCVRNGPTDFYCECASGFTGLLCKDVASHPCDSSPCLNGGTCVRFTNSFACNCAPKFTGRTCDTPIRERCTSSYCRNGGTCVETNSGLKCDCRPGFQGVRCETAVQGFEWSTCSRTCGQGTRYKRCRADDTRKCERRYEDCKLRDCPPATCPIYRFGSVTECCTSSASTSCGVPQPPQSVRRVIGGTLSPQGQWPWQVAMWKKNPGIYFCGGALVSSKWVVTAGHCAAMAGVTRAEMEIVAGINKLSGQGGRAQRSGVEKIILHPTFNNPVDDVGLLKLSGEFKFTSYVQPICFPNGEMVGEDVICYAAGWGAASKEDITARRPSNDLLHVGLRTLPLDACTEGFKNTAFRRGVTDKVLCAGILAGGKDTCIGDSGGPFVCQRKNSCQWYFAGIGSFGPTQCGIGYIPAVFMDVAKYETWIKEKISNN